MRNVWRLKTHHVDPDEALRWMRVNEKIAIGWGEVGDLRTRGYASADDVKDAIRNAYPDARNVGQGGLNVWSFYDEMKHGDLVLLSSGTTRALVVEVTGDYVWEAEAPTIIYGTPEQVGEYQHQRRVRLSAWSPESLWRAAGADAAKGQSIRWSLVRCARLVT